MMKSIKLYSELIKISDFKDRYNYLRFDSKVFDITFGSHRYLNQMIYKSPKWKSIRREVILRDNGCDMAHKDYPISGFIYVHHINPITIDDILEENKIVFDLDNLVCVSLNTHNSIHYGIEDRLPTIFKERTKNDTKLW